MREWHMRGYLQQLLLPGERALTPGNAEISTVVLVWIQVDLVLSQLYQNHLQKLCLIAVL